MIALAQITMNAGKDIPGSVIQWNLRENAKHFDRVIVVDGHLTDEAKEFYSQFDNVEAIDSPWKDSYVAQYQAFADRLEGGEWCLYLDCDEIPSKTLINFTYNLHVEADLVTLPCILHITEDGKKYYPVESKPDMEYHGQWTKNILFKKNDALYFRHFGSHVIPENKSKKYVYMPCPYYHMKSLESFVYNDVWQAYLSPEGQGYSSIEAARFRMLTKQYKTTQEFKQATQEGKWSPALVRFAREHSNDFDRPISRLSWVYYLLENHPDFLSDPGMTLQSDVKLAPNGGFLEYGTPLTWDLVKQYVLDKGSMERFRENQSKGNFIEIS